MADLLLEVGCEELPARYVDVALAHLRGAVPAALAAARLEVAAEAVAVIGTPRRLAVIASGVPSRQPDLREQVVGPPASAAFRDGAPTKAAVGFAAKNGVAVAELELVTVEGKKGEYVACTRQERGKPAVDVLAGVLEGLLDGLPWPKSMRWGWREQAFARPVHWLVVLFDGAVVPMQFAGVASGRTSRGHRFLAPGPIELRGGAEDYTSRLRAAMVIVDPAVRRQAIAAELARVERESGARVRTDDELLVEVTNLVEYPVAVCGTFDEVFLEVPEEVIVSAMRSHQRYFAMEDAHGRLVHRFVTIAGTVTRDARVVRHGNERVLAARLADARFFFREDGKKALDDWAAALDDVVFQSKLGSMGAKVARARRLAAALCGRLRGVDAQVVDRAAALAKADLVTHMVGEFPELQGVMGAHYARLWGEPAPVAAAIEEHYLPRSAGGALPASAEGGCLAIADRADTVVGCFAAGLAPTGSADPYALRRAALGVIAIVLERGWRVPVSWLVAEAARELSGAVDVTDAVREQLADFFRARLRGVLVERGLPADCVDAALAAGADDLRDASDRAVAVARLRERADFEPLATAFKRIANILKGGVASAAAPNPGRFVEREERELHAAFGGIQARVADHLAASNYHAALAALAELKGPVDAFFDKVLVMDEDAAVRDNRLALLASINAAFTRIADFRQLAV
jgi:glycyl-tRNA synthetase beta chain